MELSVTIGTWNVAASEHFFKLNEISVNMRDWLISCQTEAPVLGGSDIIVVGFQEILELSPQAIVSPGVEECNRWKALLEGEIGSEYTVVTSEQLVGIYCLLFVKKSVVAGLTDVQVHRVMRGMGGLSGNKGAVVLTVRIFEIEIVFSCAHLAAGQSKITDRNDDYQSIYASLSSNADFVFFFGDLNYRIDLGTDACIETINRWREDGDMTCLMTLIEKDQLTVSKKKGLIFEGFEEGDLNFVPTYKYDLLSEKWDSSEKARSPAWTDRILYTTRGHEIVNKHYGKYSIH